MPPISNPRFTSQSATAEDLLSKQTEGLVALSDFRKRRAQVIEAKERDAEASLRLSLSGGGIITNNNNNNINNECNNIENHGEKDKVHSNKNNTNNNNNEYNDDGNDDNYQDRDGHGNLNSQKRRKINKVGGRDDEKKKMKKKNSNNLVKLSFGDEEEEKDEDESKKNINNDSNNNINSTSNNNNNNNNNISSSKILANTQVSLVPKPLTKAALTREAQTRETLRKEFLLMQEAIKNTEIEIPFVFYDGTNIPGGTCRVRKGDFIWVFLDRSRKAGAELKIGERINSRRQWARIGVDDLMLVRGDLIIPHHYDFYYFIINHIYGPNNRILFDYSTERPSIPSTSSISPSESPDDFSGGSSTRGDDKNQKYLLRAPGSTNMKTNHELDRFIEGRGDDPTFTKVVDRRWYERNKHIYPASVWQEFDLEKDYQKEVKRDLGGNAFFFS